MNWLQNLIQPQGNMLQQPVSPKPGFMQQFNNFRTGDRGQFIGDMMAGWAMGQTPQQSLGMGAVTAREGAQERRGQQQEMAQRNQTVDWLKSQGLSDEQASMVAQNPQTLQEFLTKSVMPEEPQTTDDIREYNLAVQQGYEGSFNDYMTSQRKAGATTVNVGGGPELGKLSTDYGYVLDPVTGDPVIDPETGLPRAAAVPGSPASLEQEAAARARQNAQNQTGMYGNIVLEDIGRARELIEGSPWYSPTTGAIGNILKDIGGTNAADLQELTKTVKANIGFDRLQAMREASPTGGALGQVTQQELQFLQATLGSLEQVQSEEQLLQNLDRLNAIYSNILEKAAAYPNAGEFGFTAPAGPEGEVKRPSDVPQELWEVMTPEERALWQ